MLLLIRLKQEKIMRDNTIQFVKDHKIIVIVRGISEDKLLPTAEAMYKGGIRLIEITYDAKGHIPNEKTAEMIHLLDSHFNGDMLIGAGTVLTSEQVLLTKQAGGKYIISPDTFPDVIKQTVKEGLVSMPGAMTPSEAQTAYRSGADFVKLFPIGNLGISYVKAIMAPLSHIPFLAVGGVNENNIKDYLNIGVSGFGIGANIVKKDLIESGRFDEIAALAKKYVDSVRD